MNSGLVNKKEEMRKNQKEQHQLGEGGSAGAGGAWPEGNPKESILLPGAKEKEVSRRGGGENGPMCHRDKEEHWIWKHDRHW